MCIIKIVFRHGGLIGHDKYYFFIVLLGNPTDQLLQSNVILTK
jgi:hypothetical protein